MTVPYQSDLFKNIKKSKVDKMMLELNYTTKKYMKNEIIFKGDEYIDSLGIIIKGKVLIAKETSGGNKTMIALLEENSMIGEVMAISNNKISNLVISNSDETEIIFIPIRNIYKFNDLKDNLIVLLAKKAFYMNKRVYYLQLKSIRGKLSRFLLDISEGKDSLTFSIPFNRQKMAEYLNVSRPSLSREMARFKEEGLIDYYKESIKIVNKTGLEKYQE
ncbi:MAG: transcriptional regulator crp/fnr family [Fusobacteria bacterium]|nr:MAG: transcriptional regulator crp/fnr family [Fusobacteriota bacterium]KAF0229709.1 MAG: transcriptional regulator crp/fnr [Fusobacteriota bacterium]